MADDKLKKEDAPEEEAKVEEAEVVYDPVPEEEENDFVDDNSEKQIEEKRKQQEEQERLDAEAKKAEEEETAKKDAKRLRLEESLQGGEPPVFLTPGFKGVFEYDNPELENIEKARLAWVKDSRIGSIIKVSISMVCLAAIIVGWAVPTFVLGPEAKQLPLYIALGCAGGALAIMLLTSVLTKRRSKGLVNEYFRAFYGSFDRYAYDGLDLEGLTGGVDDKITKEEFEAGKIFLNTHTVGSRNSRSFIFRGVDCALCDAAGQEERSDRTVGVSFVGKYLRMHNNANVSDDGVIIYVKGNERAIPPSAILQRDPALETPYYNVYGSYADLDALPKEFMEQVEKIRTDKLLVDVTISIQKGRTYFYLGYEDTLMVLPNKEPFNPNYLISFKNHLRNFLEMGILL